MTPNALNSNNRPTSFDGAGFFSKIDRVAPSEPPDLPNFTRNDLDYECVPLNVLAEHQNLNRIKLPADVEGSALYPLETALEPEETLVYAVTGTTGLIKGTLFECPYYIKLSNSRKCEEMWRVRFERDTSELPTRTPNHVILHCKFIWRSRRG